MDDASVVSASCPDAAVPAICCGQWCVDRYLFVDTRSSTRLSRTACNQLAVDVTGLHNQCGPYRPALSTGVGPAPLKHTPGTLGGTFLQVGWQPDPQSHSAQHYTLASPAPLRAAAGPHKPPHRDSLPHKGVDIKLVIVRQHTPQLQLAEAHQPTRLQPKSGTTCTLLTISCRGMMDVRTRTPPPAACPAGSFHHLKYTALNGVNAFTWVTTLNHLTYAHGCHRNTPGAAASGSQASNSTTRQHTQPACGSAGCCWPLPCCCCPAQLLHQSKGARETHSWPLLSAIPGAPAPNSSQLPRQHCSGHAQHPSQG